MKYENKHGFSFKEAKLPWSQFKIMPINKHKKLYSITEYMKIPKMFFTVVLQI
jgi:hypothetical protein